MAQGEDGTFRSVCQQNAIKTDLLCGLRFTSGGNGIKTNLGENVETPGTVQEDCPAQWQRQTRSADSARLPARYWFTASSMDCPPAITSGAMPCAANESAAPWPMPPQITACAPLNNSTKPAWLPQAPMARER